MEVQPAEVEVDRVGEPLTVSKPPAANLDHPDLAVEALRRIVGEIQDNGIEDTPQMVPDRPGSLLDWLHATAHRPGQPPLPAIFGPGPADIVPERHGHPLDRPGLGGL